MFILENTSLSVVKLCPYDRTQIPRISCTTYGEELISFNAESGVIDGPNVNDLGSNYVIRKVQKTDNTT